MSTIPLFKNRHGNVAVVKGKHTFHFNSGRYWPKDDAELKVLQELADRKGQGVYIDPNEPDIDPSAATPLDVMKKRIIAEYLADQAKIKDAGNYEAPNLQKSAASTASSEVNGNTLATEVAKAALLGEQKITPVEEKKEQSALEKLQALQGKQ